MATSGPRNAADLVGMRTRELQFVSIMQIKESRYIGQTAHKEYAKR